MSEDFVTRMGDGRTVRMTKQQIMDDAEAGMNDGADCAGVPVLDSNDLENIVETICAPGRVVSVPRGNEVVLSEDGGPYKLILDSGSSGDGIDMSRTAAIQVHEKALGLDTFQLATVDYSLKAVKPIISMEQQTMEEASMLVTVPLLYGCMPNMGLYYAPDGPYGNPADLMREFKIEEAQQQAELASERLSKDIVFVADAMMAAGSEGFNFDTTASAGDADFVGTLRGVEQFRKEHPEAYIEMGMSSENVLGIHGSIEYDGKIVAGLYPQDQVRLAEKAGVNIFGPVVNTNTSRSFAWNIARAVTIIKECEKVSKIPCHANMGMGVGGIPMLETPPLDCVSRGSKLMVEIAHVDGI
jgi:dimethylamine--corrinoid protein Co-methyltransferase